MLYKNRTQLNITYLYYWVSCLSCLSCTFGPQTTGCLYYSIISLSSRVKCIISVRVCWRVSTGGGTEFALRYKSSSDILQVHSRLMYHLAFETTAEHYLWKERHHHCFTWTKEENIMKVPCLFTIRIKEAFSNIFFVNTVQSTYFKLPGELPNLF